MKHLIAVRLFVSLIGVVVLPGVVAADDNTAPPAGKPIESISHEAVNALEVSAGKDSVHYVTEATWAGAGYNNEEIVYTILITNHDSRVLRCTTEVKGVYFENGKKFEIADRQSSTVFPDQQVQAGNWLGMDQKSGATYSVKCRAI
jgi:hypothetical protein